MLKHTKYMRVWRKNNREKVRKAVRKWQKNNPEKVSKINREYAKRNRKRLSDIRKVWYRKHRKRILKSLRQSYCPAKHRILARKTKYGLGELQFDILIKQQKNRCGICELKFSQRKKSSRPHVDHCHLTDKIRGLLCSKCNLALGLFGDQAKVLRKAAKYLEKSR